MVNHGRRVVARLLAGLLVLVGAVALTSQPANAETGGYPYWNYNGPGSNANGSEWHDPNGGNFSPYGYVYRNCTDFVAWKLATVNGFSLGGTIGHAKDWGVWANTDPHKYPVDMNPAVGSVAWWNNSTYGHVAYVSAVSADGNTVTIQEYNWQINNGASYDGAYHTRDISRTAVSGYIHFKDGGGSTNLADGQVVENLDTSPKFHYVAAGGRLFWYDRYNSSMESAFVSQQNGKATTTKPLKPLFNQQILPIEANRDNAGNYVPRSHPPNDNTFMYEYGTTAQYMMQYGYASLLASGNEAAYLDGANKAIMIPPGSIAPMKATANDLPQPPLGTILQTMATNDPDYEYQRDQYGTVELLWANNVTVQDCIRVVKGGGAQRVPQAMVNQFLGVGTYHGNASTCAFNEQVVYYGTGGAERWQITGNNGSAPYVRRKYASTLAMHCYRGPAPTIREISPSGINAPTQGLDIHCPNNTYLKNNQTGQAFQWWDGQLHYISSPELLGCLTQGHPEVVIPLDESAFGGATQGTPAHCQYEGKLLQAPNGQVFWVKDGSRRYVGNAQILNCLSVRANAGVPIPVPVETVNSYTLGANAYCTYPASIRFVRGDGQAEVWRVFTDGTRQHAGSLCQPQSDPRYYVHVVPAGEVDGHQHVGTFDATPTNCAAIP